MKKLSIDGAALVASEDTGTDGLGNPAGRSWTFNTPDQAAKHAPELSAELALVKNRTFADQVTAARAELDAKAAAASE